MRLLGAHSLIAFAICVTAKSIPDDQALDESHGRRPFRRICPLERCNECPTTELITAPGIGFALEMGYGTAAIRWHNGTTEPIAMKEGSPSYLQLMQSLSRTTWGTRFPNFPEEIPSTRGKIEYIRTRILRFLNKFIGRPANEQTSVIINMIYQLQNEIGNILPPGTRVTHAVVSSPDSILLDKQEIDDALEYLHIKNLMSRLDGLFAASAAFAGFGRGLCEQYTSGEECEKEEYYMPKETILHLDFSNVSLAATMNELRSYKTWGVDRTFVDTDLGYNKAAQENDGRDLFAKIQNRIKDFVEESQNEITQLLLTGNRASERRFIDAIKNALHHINGRVPVASRHSVDASELSDVDFLFATAKGAAEVAKRRRSGPVRCTWRYCDNSSPDTRQKVFQADSDQMDL